MLLVFVIALGLGSAASAQDKNSPAAFGARMRYRLQDLIDHPYSFVPSYESRYKTFLKYSDSMTPHQAYAMTVLLGPDSARGYDNIPNTFALTFPEAHAVDLTEQVGWYYFAGNVRGKNGIDYGVLLMMFQYTLLPPPIAEHFGLTPVQNQMMDVQLAITAGRGRMHQADPPFFAGTTGDIDVADRLFVRAGKNVIDTPSKGVLYPMTLRASGVDRGGAAPVPVAVDITLTSGKGIILQGADGCEPCIGALGTRYYSIPQLVMDPAKSRITIGDSVIDLESGMFWFDHQWGTGMIPAGTSPYPVLRAAANLAAPAAPGWDFFVMNFDDGSAITLNHLQTAADAPWRDQKGPSSPPARPPVPVVGKYMDPVGTVFDISGMVAITKWARGVTSANPALYPISNNWFPHGWTLDLCDTRLPSHMRKIRIEPISEDPSAMFFANSAQYVEAPVMAVDAAGKVRGRGFCESVGYENFSLTLAALAGLPPDVAKALKPVLPSPLLKMRSLAYVTMHKKELTAIFACASLPPPARDCGCQ